jgi:hypothetical protein
MKKETQFAMIFSPVYAVRIPHDLEIPVNESIVNKLTDFFKNLLFVDSHRHKNY